MQIADLLVVNLTNLSHQDHLELILAIRNRRRVIPPTKNVNTNKSVKRTKSAPDLTMLSKEQLEQLLKALTV